VEAAPAQHLYGLVDLLGGRLDTRLVKLALQVDRLTGTQGAMSEEDAPGHEHELLALQEARRLLDRLVDSTVVGLVLAAQDSSAGQTGACHRRLPST
jgi:hypothetical protein